MGYMTITILAIAGFSLLMGFLIGFVKGFTRSLFNLIVIVASIVLAIIFKEIATDLVIKNVNVNGVNIQDYILNMICKDDYAALKPNVEPIVRIIIGIAVFVCEVIAFNVVLGIISTIIIFVILGRKKRGGHLIGGLIGLAAGAVTAFVMCTCISGLARNIASLSEAKMDGTPIIETMGISEMYEQTGVEEYNDSAVSKIFFKVPVVYDSITSTKIDGEKYTLDGQIQAVKVSLALLDSLSRLSKLDFSNGLNDSNVAAATSILNDLGIETKDLPKEVINTINNLIINAASALDAGIDLHGVDLGAIDFAETAKLFEVAYEIESQTTAPTSEQIDRLLEKASSSGAIELLKQTSVAFNLDEDDKNAINAKIDSKTELTAEEKAALREIL